MHQEVGRFVMVNYCLLVKIKRCFTIRYYLWGDGRTTFGLPDLRGRAAIGPRRGPGLSDYELGEKGGVESVTLTTLEMPQHNH